jgi:multiple sugar transport system ATP-binding protein
MATEGGALRFSFGEAGVLDAGADAALQRQARAATSAELVFGARPEDIEIASNEAPGGLNGVITFVEPVGPRTIVHIKVDGQTVKVAKEKRYPVKIGAAVRLLPPLGKCHLFDAATGDAIGRA